MPDDIVFLTPLGQLLRRIQREQNLTKLALARSIGIEVDSLTKAMVAPLASVAACVKRKISRYLDMPVLPEYPEELSPMDAIVYKYKDDNRLRFPFILYRSLRKSSCTHTISQFMWRFAGDLIQHIRKKCPGLMKVEASVKYTVLPECSVCIDMHCVTRPITKMRMVLSFDRDLPFVRVWLAEVGQFDNVPLEVLHDTQLTVAIFNRIVHSHLSKFCGGKNRTVVSAVDRMLQKKKNVAKYEERPAITCAVR